MRVLVLGAVRLYREGLTALLPIKADAEVVTAGCGRDDLSAHQLGADVIVVDGAAIGCLDIVRSISRIVPAARVLLVGAPQSEQEIVAYAEAGVAAFLEPEAGVDELAAALDSIERGEAFCPPRIAGILLRRVKAAGLASSVAPIPELTVRQQEVVDLIAEGLSNKEITRRLVIEVATVKNHVHNILEKLRVNRRTEAAARLYSARMVATPHQRI
jgi:two-component system, NarL family, nitrate/nitrite response regulator NarL